MATINTKQFYKSLIFLFTVLYEIPFIFGQHENPADKYVDSYKKYLGAPCPLIEDNIKHFVYFARDRHEIFDNPFLKVSRFAGAQIMYSWQELEPEKNQYDFSMIREDRT